MSWAVSLSSFPLFLGSALFWSGGHPAFLTGLGVSAFQNGLLSTGGLGRFMWRLGLAARWSGFSVKTSLPRAPTNQ